MKHFHLISEKSFMIMSRTGVTAELSGIRLGSSANYTDFAA